ncbi:MAG: hypothetical protein D6807_00905 [Alphaproteobacteria bacterium]|nr:MAG: hypothetical protein D6807_00905 [Alphaproteobacteria bacterium]
MRGILLVASHEFVETVRSKSFLVSLILIPLMLGVGLAIPTWIEHRTSAMRTVAVVDLAGGYAERLAAAVNRRHAREVLSALHLYVRAYARSDFRTAQGLDIERVPAILARPADAISDAEADRFLAAGGAPWALELARPYLRADAPEPQLPPQKLRIVPLADPPPATVLLADPAAALGPWLHDGGDAAGKTPGLAAVILIPPDVTGVAAGSVAALGRGDPRRSVQIWSDGALPRDMARTLKGTLDDLFRRDALLATAGTRDILAADRVRAPVVALDISAPGGRALTLADTIRRILPKALSVMLVYFLYINMFMLMSNTMEERSNRIVEVLISSITPRTLMIGKLLGSSLVAVAMFGFSVLAFFGIFSIAGDSAVVEFAGIVLGILKGSAIVPLLFLYFVLGYFLFAGIFLTLGAFAESNRDVQNLSLPVVLFMAMMPVVVIAFADDPNGTSARVLSFLPFFGPFMMMARANASPPVIEILGSVAVQLLTILALLWAAARVFRVAILFSGRPPRFRQLLRFLRGEE